MDYQNLLIEWGLSNYMDSFEEEGITDESFQLIDEQTMNCIFKKKGPLLIFRKRFTEYLQQQQNSPLRDIEMSTSNTSTDTLTDTSEIYQFDLDDTPEMTEVIFKVPSAVRLEAVECSSSKKVKIDSLFPNGLESLLKTNPDGRLALASRHKLTNDLRQKVSKIIINELVSKSLGNYKIELKADTFIKAAEEIVGIFPSERVETYYIPYSSPKSGLRQPARGKLWSRYVNVRAALRVADSHTSALGVNREEKENIPEECQNQLTFLKAAVEPYQKVLQAWENTYILRNKFYKNKGLDEIYEDFPCLRTQFGLQLLESDFNQLYKEKVDIIYSEWPKVSLAIVQEAMERKISIPENRDKDISTQALLLLPLLFSPVTLKKASKNNWRPTRSEIKESFFFIAKDFSSLSEILERRKLKLESYQIPFQPFGVAMGEVDNIDTYYIIINDVRYSCDSSIRCLELLFKAIHALNLEYPLESKHIWLFIQEMVFKMATSCKSSSTACVIADITYHLQCE